MTTKRRRLMALLLIAAVVVALSATAAASFANSRQAPRPSNPTISRTTGESYGPLEADTDDPQGNGDSQ